MSARFRGVLLICRSQGFSASRIARATVSSSGRSISSGSNESVTNALETSFLTSRFCRALTHKKGFDRAP
jgi:hypothetical protein